MFQLTKTVWRRLTPESGVLRWVKTLKDRHTLNPRHVIYIPGLGDPRPAEQKLVTGVWKFYGVTAHYYPLVWKDPQPFEQKLEGLLTLIDQLADAGNSVSLVGVSAGASAALNAFVQRKGKLQAVIFICGKIDNFDSVSPETFAHNPPFRESLAKVEISLSEIDTTTRKRILSLHPLQDGTVPIKDMFIEGASNKLLPCVGHSASIVYADTIGSYRIFRFIQSVNRTFPKI